MFDNNTKIGIEKIIDFIVAFISVLLIAFVEDDPSNLPFVGTALIVVSIYVMIRGRKNKMLFFLLFIISMINISIGAYDCLLEGVDVSAWQLSGLRATKYNTITAKGILLFVTMFNLFIKDDVLKNEKKSNFDELRINNTLISYMGVLVMYVVLVYALISQLLTRNLGDYQSVSSPVFEYCVIVLCVTWYYSKNNQVVDWLILLYVFFYSIIFLAIGDRSSVFMYLLMLYLLYFQKRFTVWAVLGFSLIGIFCANIIGIMRSAGAFNFSEIISMATSRGLYVDTFSWSYYAGIAITALAHTVDSKIPFCLAYILSFFGIKNDFSSFTVFALNYNGLYNNGGGFCSPYLYMCGGYLGIVVGAVFIAFVINMFFSNKKPFNSIYQAVIVAMSLRWYLYNPVTLFRGILLLMPLLLIACRLFDNTTRSNDTQSRG